MIWESKPSNTIYFIHHVKCLFHKKNPEGYSDECLCKSYLAGKDRKTNLPIERIRWEDIDPKYSLP